MFVFILVCSVMSGMGYIISQLYLMQIVMTTWDVVCLLLAPEQHGC